MEMSSCCGAPIVIEYQSDTTNFSDDEYDLKVPVQVCSLCGVVISKKLLPREFNQNEPDAR